MRTNSTNKINGFTLIELLVASVIGMITILAAGQVLIQQMQSSTKINQFEQLRSNWIKTKRFITNEINLSSRVEKELTSKEKDDLGENIPCNIGDGKVKMVIRFPRHNQLDPAIYYTVDSEEGWSNSVLKRCGPALKEDGSYDTASAHVNNIVIDGLKNADDGFTTTITGKKLAKFNINLEKLKESSFYRTEKGARSRISELYIRPNNNRLCDSDRRLPQQGVKIVLKEPQTTFISNSEANILVCGNRLANKLEGYIGNDQIEAINPGKNTLIGAGGDDRLIGSDEVDYLYGGCPEKNANTCNDGDDILIAMRGNDVLEGNEGTNHYVPGLDDKVSRCDRDTVNGSDGGYDVIYFKDDQNKYQLSDSCTKGNCRVQRLDSGDRKTVDINKGDLLVFKDTMKELDQGEAKDLPTLNPDSCKVDIN